MTIPRDPSDRDALAGQILGGYLAGWEPDERAGLLSDLTMSEAKPVFTCIPHGYHSTAGPCPDCAAEAAADVLGRYGFTADDLRAGFADGGTITMSASAAPESLCRTCLAPITLIDGVWTSDSRTATCRTGRPHQPMGGAA